MRRQRGFDPSRRAFLAAGASGAAAGLGFGCGGRTERAPVPDEIAALHRDLFVLDLHIDTLLWMRLFGFEIEAEHTPPLPFAAFLGHMDLPRARAGGLDGAALAMVINPDEVLPELMLPLRGLAAVERSSGLAQTLETLALLEDTAARLPDEIAFARSGTEMRAARAAGRFAALAALEGAHGIGASLDALGSAVEAGLRMVGLVHFQSSAAASPMTVAARDAEGLTPFGNDLIDELERQGVVVDLAHTNARGVAGALARARRPCVVSHTACRALCDIPRNLTDDQIRAVAERGGVIGLAVGRWFVGRPGLAGFLDHVDHAVRVGGADAVAIGSDWDGAIVPVAEMEDVGVLPHVTHGLLERGHGIDVVRKVMGENALRVITDVCG